MTGLSFALFYATLALPIARLTDRTVRTRVVAASLAIWSAMTAMIGLAGSMPASQSIIADIYPPNMRATAFSLLGLSLPVGLMLGYAGAGMLEKHLGWRGAFAVIGLGGLLLAPLLLWTIREPQRGRFDPPPPPAILRRRCARRCDTCGSCDRRATCLPPAPCIPSPGARSIPGTRRSTCACMAYRWATSPSCWP